MKIVVGKLTFLILLSWSLTAFGANTDKFILLSGTFGPIDSGILTLLEDEFEKESGIRVRHVGAGTGAALDIARQCHVDLVMVHARPLEEKFIADGFGTQRIPLMYNDFVIVGPVADPAGIGKSKTAAEALNKIMNGKTPFISRGDNSGTHVAEMELWEKAAIKPEGSWYVKYEKGAEGNSAVLKYADEKKAYTVIDRATYLALKDRMKLVILVEGDEALLNFISLIPVNPATCPDVNVQDTQTFVDWLVSPEKGQLIIRDFGKEKFGSSLFFPHSSEWQKSRKK